MSTLLAFVGFWWPWLAVLALFVGLDWLGTRFEWGKPPRDRDQ